MDKYYKYNKDLRFIMNSIVTITPSHFLCQKWPEFRIRVQIDRIQFWPTGSRNPGSGSVLQKPSLYLFLFLLYRKYRGKWSDPTKIPLYVSGSEPPRPKRGGCTVLKQCNCVSARYAFIPVIYHAGNLTWLSSKYDVQCFNTPVAYTGGGACNGAMRQEY